MLTGTWTPLTNLDIFPSGNNPGGINGTMELLSDGSVMVAVDTTKAWDKLTPDATGSYVNGTWSQLASMSTLRLYDSTNVLPDGRVLVLGGQYTDPPYTQTFTNTGEIYNPVKNTWAAMANFPESTFGAGPTMLLPDGRLLAGTKNDAQTYIYDPGTNVWTNSSPTTDKLDNDTSGGENWIKLPDGSILSVNLHGNIGRAQRFDPATMTWIDSGALPVAWQNAGQKPGPVILLPDGRVFQLGQNNTALYTPSTIPGGTGTWADGPVIPRGLSANPGSAAMMPNGHVLFSAGGTVDGPVHIFEFDPNAPSAISLTDVTPDAILSTPSQAFVTRMLVLPSGQVLAVLPRAAGQLDVYTPDGARQAGWKPMITGIVPKASNYRLTGTQLNGLSAGASYSHGAEMDTNYPIIELKNGSGHVVFRGMFNWSSTGVATGSTPVNADFSLPANMAYGTYSLTVVANGIASDPVSFTGGVVGPSADLVVTNIGPSTCTEGNYIIYNLSITNNGPSTATNVVLTDTLDANLNYSSATKSKGTSTHFGSLVTFSFGSVAVGQTVTATVTAQSTEDGNLTTTAVVTSSVSDANLLNNTAVATVAVSEPPIVVSGPITVSGKSQSNVTVATFTHASGVEPASDFVATINWGDGSTSTGGISLSGSSYRVKGSHTYASRGSHTVTTTVVEVSGGGGGSMSALAVASTSTPTNPTDNEPAATLVQPVEAGDSPPRLLRDAVDQVLSTVTGKGSRRLLHATANDGVLDDVFALD